MGHQDAPVGSRWFMAGHHWSVDRHIEHDGEPGVLLRCMSAKGRGAVKLPYTLRTLERRAARQDERG